MLCVWHTNQPWLDNNDVEQQQLQQGKLVSYFSVLFFFFLNLCHQASSFSHCTSLSGQEKQREP